MGPSSALLCWILKTPSSAAEDFDAIKFYTSIDVFRGPPKTILYSHDEERGGPQICHSSFSITII